MNQFDPQKLRTLINTQGMSQADLSRRLGVSRASVSRILRGKRKPGSDFIAALKTAFPNTPLDYFFSPGVANKCHLKEASTNV